MRHDLIITDNSYRSCLILIYTACGCCVHVSCHETAKSLAMFFFIFILFFIFLRRGGMGVAVEVILEDFISEIVKTE